MKNALLSSLLLFTFFSASAQDTTNSGTEFWVAYGHHQFMETGSNGQNMTIYLATGTLAATVTISIDSSGSTPAVAATWWQRTYIIPANTVIDIETTAATIYSTGAGAIGAIPKSGTYDARLYNPFAGSVGTYRHRAIHIQSTVPIVAYTHIYGSASSGATMLIPIEAWGGLYTSANSTQSYASNAFSWLYIIAKYNNTIVEITPTVKTVGQNITGLQPGITKTITLMKGQIYQVLGANLGSDADGNGGSSAEGYELTGTKVKSIASATGYIHPIAVFSGSSRTTDPASCGLGGGDNDIQQHFPRQAWGKRYLTSPTSQSSSPSAFMINNYKIVVTDPATVVRRNGVQLAGLVNSSYYTYQSTTPDFIESDQPILVAEFMTGGGCLGSGNGDPEMFYLSPLSQAIKSASFYRNTKEAISENYLTLIIPTNGLSSLVIDGLAYGAIPPASIYTYPHPQFPGYSVVVRRWVAAQAQASVQSDSAFVGMTYGLGPVESYGYNIGTKLNAVNARDASQLPPGFTGDEVLPLKLLDFTAKKSNSDVIVRWLTTSQVNVDRFEVERSINGAEFIKVATVVSASSQGSYEAFDKNVLTSFASYSKLYYRLKIIDKDGKLSYSGIAVVKLENASDFEVNAAPNPFTDKLQLQVQTGTAGVVKINIRDLTGRLIDIRSQQVSNGSSIIEIQSLNALPKGMYIAEVEMNQAKRYLKVLK